MKKTFVQDNPSVGQPSDVLRLNVGGTCIDVLRRTLTSVEGSMLATKFSGRWDDGLEKDAEGNFFIDADIELFLPMINYLRNQAFMTPGAPPVASPRTSPNGDFLRMLEYYGMTLGIFPFGIYHFVSSTKDVLVSGLPEYNIEASDFSTFRLLPMPGNEFSDVKSFEVVLGRFTIARIGWMARWNEHRFVFASVDNGVGYTGESIALDCGRVGIATGEISSLVSVQDGGLSSIAEGDVIRCEDTGEKWYVNGRLVASSSGDDGVPQIPTASSLFYNTPCFSLRGNLRVSKIELTF